jgi:hypothetical protein
MAMNLKKAAIGLMAGLVSAALLAGCGGGGGNKGGDDPKKSAATPAAQVEMKGEPASTFQIGNKTAKIYALKAPAADDKFLFVGQRVVYANGAIYLHGEMSDGKGGDVQGLYKLPLQGDTITGKEMVAASDGDSGDQRNLAVCRDKVLFQLKDGDKLGLYNGKSLDKSDGKWKDDYDSMVGLAEGSELLMVRGTDKVCVANQELSDIKGVKVVVDEAKKALKLEDVVLRPVYADANELFLSTPLSFENFTTDLVVFDKKGKLLARYAGLKDDPADWAVTKHYLVQASATGDVLIYDRSNGKKVFNARVNQFVPRYLYSMGGDMILACDNVTKFYILKLE